MVAERAPAAARTLIGALAVVAACSSTAPTPSPPPDGSGVPQVVETPPAFPGSVAATEWRVTSEPPPGMAAADTDHETASSLLAAFVTLLRDGAQPEPVEVRAGFVGEPTDRRAEAFVYVSAPDDAVAGEEYLVSMMYQRRGWFVARVETRTHCRRGVDAASDLCVG